MAVTNRRAALARASLLLAVGACSRADLDAITMICPSPALQPGDGTQMVQVGGVDRSYVLHVPSAYDGSRPVPLILDFHGLATSGMRQLQDSPYPAVTDPEGAVMAFPSGLAGPSGPGWNVGPCCVANVDDVAFARAVVAQVSMTACIDPKRVYAVGFSMGGGMAHYLACHAADLFAAAAPASFDLLQENVTDCQPPRPITVISFRGSGDNLVPYDGGFSSVVSGMPVTFLGALGSFQKWAEIDGCTGSPSPPDGNGCSTYSACRGGVEVVLCTTPGGQTYGDAAVSWPVLKRHPLP
jgi:polyhydroxybutyrate depolymerase